MADVPQFPPIDLSIFRSFQQWNAIEEGKEPAELPDFISQTAEKTGVPANNIKYMTSVGLYAGARNDAGERHGFGRAIFVNGDQYIGEYAHSKRVGVGKYIFANKLSAVDSKLLAEMTAAGGQASEVIPGHVELTLGGEERANFITQTGAKLAVPVAVVEASLDSIFSYYEGSFSDNQRNGQGKMKYRDGSVYTGGFANGKLHGEGTYTYGNGDSYTGSFVAGQKHGLGVYTFAANGSQLNGNWEGGKIVSGKWILSGAIQYEGSFSNNKPLGKGQFLFAEHNVSVSGEYGADQFWRPQAIAPL